MSTYKAICDALASDGAFVTNWVVVAECIGPDGEPYLMHEQSEDITAWARWGMLNAAIEVQEHMLDLTTDDGEELDDDE